MSQADITTDYLVIGAGMTGLSFVDELFTRTNASITIVDKRDQPGGHWNDAYPFVKLHQPSSFYGVESMELHEYHVDQDGPNKGFMSLASGQEITAYCQTLMRDRLLPSGRVTFLPLTEYLPDGSLRGILSGKRSTVKINKKLVDASYYTNSIPILHKRPFTVGKSVTCIPPNDLPRAANSFPHYTILGGGKTGIDSCMWLLSHGTDPGRIRWIVPNDYWYINRAKTQPNQDLFLEVFGCFAKVREALAIAENPLDLALRLEKVGWWHRLDPNVTPYRYHAATVSPGEADELRRIKDVVRRGRVTKIEAERLTLTEGTVTTPANSLYIDCTASALQPKPLVPVFQPGKIVLQLVKFPLVAYSGAQTAFVESLPLSDEEKNYYSAPVAFYTTIDEYVGGSILPDFQNRVRAMGHPELREWVRRSRLDGFSRVADSVRPDETEKIALLERVKSTTAAAAANLPKLVASANMKARL